MPANVIEQMMEKKAMSANLAACACSEAFKKC
jgi:hypothetical protein